jgi:hypothetical protein
VDLADRLLGVVVRLLPPERLDWGRAMRAELAGVEAARARMSFVLGCVGAVVRQPGGVGRVGYGLLVLVALGGAVRRAGALSYGPLRVGVVGLVCVLVAVSWFGRRRGVLGPVRRSPVDRVVRAGGYLVVVGLTVGILPALWKHPDQPADGTQLAAVLAVVLGTFLVGFLAVTAERSAVDARALAVGAGAAVLSAGVWGAVVVAVRPIPTDLTPAVVAVGLGMALAAFDGAGRRRTTAGRLLAALFAGVVGTLSIVVLVGVLAAYGPPSLIPDLVGSVALTPADALDQSRAEIQDPYVAVAFGGFLLAALLAVLAVGTRQRRPIATPAVRV